MAMGTPYVTVPAVAAAIGVYFYDHKQSKTKHSEVGFQASVKRLVAKAKEEMRTTQLPKLAPEFDGLHCFETMVAR